MARYLLKRLLLALVTLVGVVVVAFVLTRLLPGNPAVVKAGAYAEPAVVQRLEEEMGLHQPIWVQFGRYAGGVLRGDLGSSSVTGQPVLTDILQRFPATLELATLSILIAVLIGVPLGVLAAVRARSWIDRLAQGVVIVGGSLPLFFVGLLIVYVFYFQLRIAPAPTGRTGAEFAAPDTLTGFLTLDALISGDVTGFGAVLGQLIWPALALATVTTGTLVKMTRHSMYDVLGADYIRTARAIGMPSWRIVMEDALPNALIPVVTSLGMTVGFLLAGNVIVEHIFAWPGLGSYAWNALLSNDFDSIQGFILTIAIVFVAINLVIDLLYVTIDPRIRL
jgi:ABC-type dipeptide/oligopeptide/nickel transport system permease component